MSKTQAALEIVREFYDTAKAEALRALSVKNRNSDPFYTLACEREADTQQRLANQAADIAGRLADLFAEGENDA